MWRSTVALIGYAMKCNEWKLKASQPASQTTIKLAAANQSTNLTPNYVESSMSYFSWYSHRIIGKVLCEFTMSFDHLFTFPSISLHSVRFVSFPIVSIQSLHFLSFPFIIFRFLFFLFFSCPFIVVHFFQVPSISFHFLTFRYPFEAKSVQNPPPRTASKFWKPFDHKGRQNYFVEHESLPQQALKINANMAPKTHTKIVPIKSTFWFVSVSM